MIFSLIGFYILFLGYNNFKKGFLYFLIFKIFLTTNITLVSMPGVPLLSLDLFMILCFALLFLLRERKRYHCPNFPFKVPFAYVFMSYFLSTLFAYVGFTGALSRFVLTICQEIVIVWLIWHIVEKDDFSFLAKGFAYSFLFISLYGIFEHYLQSNPLMTYEMSLLGDADKAVGGGYGTSHDARGYRTQSVFEHPIGGGLNWGLYIVWMLIIMVKFKTKLPNIAIVISAIFFSIACIFFTNCRGPILFFFICFLAFIKLKLSKSFFLLGASVIVIFVIVNSIPEYSTMFASFFSEDANADMEGSSSDMRFNQLAAAVAIMNQSPLFGLGFKFQEVYYNAYVDDLLGMESVWFFALTTLGLVGVAAYVFLAFYSIIKIPLKYRSKLLFFISLAYWITASLTSLPGFHLYMYYLVLFYIIKKSVNKKQFSQIVQ